MRRKKRPPAVKWMADQRAYMAGRAEQLAQKIAQANAEQLRHQAVVEALADKLKKLHLSRAAVLKRAADFAQALDVANARVEAASLEVVKGWSDWRPRGALTSQILAVLLAANGQPVPFEVIFEGVVAASGVTWSSSRERETCRHRLRKHLRHLRDQGRLESEATVIRTGTGPRRGCLWRLPDLEPAMNRLRALAATSGIATKHMAEGNQ